MTKLNNADFKGKVASFHTDVKMYTERFEPTFKSWANGLNVIGTCRNGDLIQEWIKQGGKN